MKPEITESPQGIVNAGSHVEVRGTVGDEAVTAHEVTMDGAPVHHQWKVSEQDFVLTFTAPEARGEGQILLVTIRNGHGEDSKAIPLAPS